MTEEQQKTPFIEQDPPCKRLDIQKFIEFKLYMAYWFLCTGLAVVFLLTNTCLEREETFSLKWGILGTMIGWFVVTLIHSVYYDSLHRICTEPQVRIRMILMFALYTTMTNIVFFYNYYTYSQNIFVVFAGFINLMICFPLYFTLFWERRFECGTAHEGEIEECPDAWFMLFLDVLYSVGWFSLIWIPAIYNSQLSENTPVECQVI